MIPGQSLPTGWRWTTLGEIADLKGGLTKGKKRKNGERLRSVPYLRVANVQRGYLDLDQVKLIEATETEIEELRLRTGDVLFNEGGDRDKLGRGWIWEDALPECVHQNHVFRARLHNPGVEPKFVSWYANSEGAGYFNDQGKQTTNLASINLTRLSQFPLPLAPTPEQHRIVAEIESQFTRLDAAAASLRRADANLRAYRASVLSTGCQDCRWVELGELSWDASYGTSVKCEYNASGPPVIRIPNVRGGSLCFADLKRATSVGRLTQEAALCSGDLLVIRTNGSRSLIGRCALVEQAPPTLHYFASYLIRFRLTVDSALQKWLRLIWDSPRVRSQIVKAAATSAGQYNVSIPALRKISVPLPSRDIDRRLAEVERCLSIAENIESTINASLRRAERLRHSILKRAFEGRIVPQNPNDEPAAQLLARIQLESPAKARTKAADRGT